MIAVQVTDAPTLQGPNHAFLVGQIVGILHTLVVSGDRVETVVEDEGYTGRILVHRPSGVWAIDVTPFSVVDA